MQQNTKLTVLLIACLALLDVALWWEVVQKPAEAATLSILDVGQGDATLLELEHKVAILTDAGPDKSVVGAMGRAMPSGKKSIDLAIITHPQQDHYNGFNFLLGAYRIGAFIINGRDAAEASEWTALHARAKKEKIPIIALQAGDSIRYKDTSITFLSPGEEYRESAELNDTGLVGRIITEDFTALLVADVGYAIENFLMKKGENLRADVLKIGHHGSRFSSSEAFLRSVNPMIATIGVGQKNRYGHPTKETLRRIEEAGAKIFRTDMQGNIRISVVKGKARVVTER